MRRKQVMSRSRVWVAALFVALNVVGVERSQAGNGVEWHCLALNVYHEARGENAEGQLAVARVTLNRVKSDLFPDSVCEVVWQPRQFSWTHDQHPDKPADRKAWADALAIARSALDSHHQTTPLDKATYFHASNVWPHWAEEQILVRVIGNHLFYE